MRLSVISGGWWSVLLFLLFFSSICRVLLHLHGGSDQRSGARWLHLWLHGLLYKDGNINRLIAWQPLQNGSCIKHSLISLSGRASLEQFLCCDDVILGRRCSPCPLLHHHPPHVQRVHLNFCLSCVHSTSPLMKVFYSYRKSYRSLGLLWAGSSIAQQIVLIPGVVIGESTNPRGRLRTFIMLLMFSPVQENMGLTFDQPFGGTSRSSWFHSGRRSCSSEGPE